MELVELPAAQQAIKFDSGISPLAKNINKFDLRGWTFFFGFSPFFDARMEELNQLGIRFNSGIIPLAKLNSIFDDREIKSNNLVLMISARAYFTNNSLIMFDIRPIISNILTAIFNARKLDYIGLGIHFGSREVKQRILQMHYHALFQKGWNIYLREISSGIESFLGFIDGESNKKLSDIFIPDGEYEIEVRVQNLFWDDCRDGKKLTFKVSAGILDSSNLPAIINFRREIKNEIPRFKWSIHGEYSPPEFHFGIWLSDSSSIDISGEPDYSQPYFPDQSDYFRIYYQSSSKYAAIAAYFGNQRGPKSEIYIPWPSNFLESPPNQSATNNN